MRLPSRRAPIHRGPPYQVGRVTPCAPPVLYLRLLVIRRDLRRWSVDLNLGDHFLQARSKHFNLLF